MMSKSIVFAVAMLASSSVFASVTEQETFSFPLNDGGRLSVSNVNGSITIVGGSGDTVEIIATKKGDDQEYLDAIEINISSSADSIIIETELPESGSWFSWGDKNGQVKYEITVPAGTNLDAIETVNGGLEISGVSGDVKAETVNGGINATDLEGDAEFSTVNGRINGEFTRLSGQQRVKAATVNGRVTIILSGDVDVEISADTLNGSINAKDFGLETDKGFVGSDLNGKIGSGSARLNIDTVNGSIKIRSK